VGRFIDTSEVTISKILRDNFYTGLDFMILAMRFAKIRLVEICTEVPRSVTIIHRESPFIRCFQHHDVREETSSCFNPKFRGRVREPSDQII